MAVNPGETLTKSKESQEPDDLGFGTKLPAREVRLLNRDGSFNVERRGVPLHLALNFYHLLTGIGWPTFILVVLAGYLTVNMLFSMLYMAVGVEHLVGANGSGTMSAFWDAFFFSAQTLTTVGYGRISPEGIVVSMIAAIESLAGLMGFAIATGLLYSRFARPRGRILFSKVCLIAPYRDGRAFMFRIANARNNQMIETEVQVSLSMVHPRTGVRSFHELSLERKSISFFPLSWTIVHPIADSSPLHGMTAEDFRTGDGEFFIQIKSFDDAFSQTVYVRNSYRFEEVVYGAKFAFIFGRSEAGITTIDLHRINEYAPADLPIPPDPALGRSS